MEPTVGPFIDFDPDRVQAALDHPQRLAALDRLALLDTGSEERFDRITALAARLLGAPVCLMSLVDGQRQFNKSRRGSDRREVSVDSSFCKYVVASRSPLVVDDLTTHAELCGHPAVTEHGMRAYISQPLRLSCGEVVGTLCAFDTDVRAWSQDDRDALATLASAIAAEAELVTCARELEASQQQLSRRTLVVERLMDELRDLRTIEQRHVAAVMQDHSLEAVMHGLQLVRAAQGSTNALLARRLEPIADDLAEAASSLRGLVGMLVPRELTDHDLSQHLLAEARAVANRFGMELIATIELDQAQLHAQARLLLARTVVELVHNACIYSGGTRVWLRASVIADTVMVRVADEGRGWSGGAGAGSSLSALAVELYALDGRLETGHGSDEFAVTLTLPTSRHGRGDVGARCA